MIPVREFELVRHPQINGLQLFIDTVQYRTPHFHQELELIWLADGALNVRIEQTQLKVGPGEMVLFHPGQLHEFRAADKGCTFMCLQILPERIETVVPAFAQLRFQKPCPNKELAAEDYNRLVEWLFAALRCYLQQEEGYELSCTGLVYQMLGLLICRMPHHMMTPGMLDGQMRRNSRALRLIQYVDENYMHKANLSDFASAEGITVGYASHFAKKALGQTYQNYVDTVRFHAACQMMATGRYQMVEICMAAGFSDYRYFCHAFQKRFGVTPEKYQRSQPQEQQEQHIHHSLHTLEQFYTRQKSLELLEQFSSASNK